MPSIHEAIHEGQPGHITDIASRGVRMRRTALGDEITVWLDDAAVTEVMLTPDRRLWTDRLGQELANTGQASLAFVELAEELRTKLHGTLPSPGTYELIFPGDPASQRHRRMGILRGAARLSKD